MRHLRVSLCLYRDSFGGAPWQAPFPELMHRRISIENHRVPISGRTSLNGKDPSDIACFSLR